MLVKQPPCKQRFARGTSDVSVSAGVPLESDTAMALQGL